MQCDEQFICSTNCVTLTTEQSSPSITIPFIYYVHYSLQLLLMSFMFIFLLFLVSSQPNSNHVQHVIASRAADYIAGDFTIHVPVKSNNCPQ